MPHLQSGFENAGKKSVQHQLTSSWFKLSGADGFRPGPRGGISTESRLNAMWFILSNDFYRREDSVLGVRMGIALNKCGFYAKIKQRIWRGKLRPMITS